MTTDAPTPSRTASGLGKAPVLRWAGALAAQLWAKSRADGITLTAAALAFVTMLSLVPLLAALSLTGVRAFEPQILEVLTRLLPYSEETLVTTLNQLLGEAEGVRGPGVLLFVLSALSLFTAVGNTLNRIWDLNPLWGLSALWKAALRAATFGTRGQGPRPPKPDDKARRHAGKRGSSALRARLISLTLLLFWGPLLLGGALSGLALLRRMPAFEGVLGAPLAAEVVTAIAFFVGLAMLYWQVPDSDVRLRSAALGAAVATVLMIALRAGFDLYVDFAAQTSRVYGSFAFLFLFVISVYFAWIIVLTGAELSYVHQHLPALLRRRAVPLPPAWLGLAALVAMGRGLRDGQPLSPSDHLAGRLHVAPDELQRALEPLVAAGLVQDIPGDTGGLVLAREPSRLELETVFRSYEAALEEAESSIEPSDAPIEESASPAALPAQLAPAFTALRNRLRQARTADLDGQTLGTLIDEVRERSMETAEAVDGAAADQGSGEPSEDRGETALAAASDSG